MSRLGARRPTLRCALLGPLMLGCLLFPEPKALAQEHRDPKWPVIEALRRARVDVSWFTLPGTERLLMRRASLGWRGGVTADTMRLLKKLDRLHTLTIHWPDPKPDEAAMTALGELTELQVLEIDAHKLGDDDLKPLAGLSTLSELSLLGAMITDDGLKFLEGLRKLQKLNLTAAPRITGAGLVHLEGLAELRDLSLGYTHVDDAGLAHLAPLKHLQTLRLPGTPIRGPGLVHLGGLAELTEISLAKTRVDDAGLAHLGPAQRVRLVDLTDAVVSHGPLRSPAAGLALEVDGGVARVIDAGAGKGAGAVFRHMGSGGIACWAISPDGRLVATGSAYRTHGSADENKGTLWVWDAANGDRKGSHRSGSILWVAFRPDSKTVVFAAEAYEVDGP